MAPPHIAQGTQFASHGTNRNSGYMMIHAMARSIYFEDRMWDYFDLLTHLNRGVHFVVLPDGQVIQHAPHTQTLWHARGANFDSCGVELLVEGVYDLSALHSKIDRPVAAFDVYTRGQYDGLLSIMEYLVEKGYVQSPFYNWDVHSSQSHGRKQDPGAAFDFATWIEMLRLRYGE